MSEIQEFYTDKTVLLTGGTGFLGKMTTEKLLRTCNIKKIFLLIRAKRGESPARRLETYFNSPVFENLAGEKSDFKQKIVIMEGNIQSPNLGLNTEDLETIMREVEVIFHWAATVNFMENLKIATDINVKSVRFLLAIARNMPQLKCFLHISTAFSHCVIKEIHETFYDDTLEGQNLITCMDSLSEKTADDITNALLGEWPNTYVYTKAAAENIIKTEGVGLPVGIHRPSIVIGSYKEPMPGWIDNWYGYTGLLLASALGYVRVVNTCQHMKINVVPADYVVNSAIAAAWEISKQNNNEIPIYNFADAYEHNLTVGELGHLSYVAANKIPTPLLMWHHFIIYAANETMFKILDWFLHYLPAHLIDIILVCSRKKPKFVKIYNKVQKMSGNFKYFGKRDWNFDNKNIASLWRSMSKEDRELFEFDMSTLIWNDYMKNYIMGCRIYLLKDPMHTVPAGKRKVLKMKILHYSVVAFLLFTLYYVISVIVNLFI